MANENDQPKRKPNVVFIMGDDIGWFNIGAYHRGIMAGRTPHLDRMAAAGMLFTGMGQSLMQGEWFAYEFWRFVFVQEEVARFAQTFVEFPPLQKPAPFNLDAVKEQVQRAIQAHHGQ